MADIRISSADTIDGDVLLLELNDGRTLQFSLEQLMTLTPIAIFERKENSSQSDAN